jgi:hypothetical protein
MEENKKLLSLEDEFEVEGYADDCDDNPICETSTQEKACAHDCIWDNVFWTSNI